MFFSIYVDLTICGLQAVSLIFTLFPYKLLMYDSALNSVNQWPSALQLIIVKTSASLQHSQHPTTAVIRKKINCKDFCKQLRFSKHLMDWYKNIHSKYIQIYKFNQKAVLGTLESMQASLTC